MKILVTGTSGQVARSLKERAALSGVEVLAVGRPSLDLNDAASVHRAITSAAPDLVVSAAAYTSVDRAEDELDLAFAINGVGAGAVAAAAATIGAPVIHLSTDYVFSGTEPDAYVESAETEPRSAYGRTKLAGEEAVAKANPNHVILRTAWVYSPFGKNFVKTMLMLARERQQVRVVADQWGNPTSALDIADGLLIIAQRLMGNARSPTGIYHLAGSGETNWSGLAERTFAISRALGGPSASVVEVSTEQYPTKAARPANSRLITEKLAKDFGWRSPRWEQSCRIVVERLLREQWS
jgi:dTDP-4-dehydrorhamnose reductase